MRVKYFPFLLHCVLNEWIDMNRKNDPSLYKVIIKVSSSIFISDAYVHLDVTFTWAELLLLYIEIIYLLSCLSLMSRLMLLSRLYAKYEATTSGRLA